MFECQGKNLKGTNWDTFAMFVCGHHPKCSLEEMQQGEGEGGPDQAPPPVCNDKREGVEPKSGNFRVKKV